MVEIKNVLALEKGQRDAIVRLLKYRQFFKDKDEWRAYQAVDNWMGKMFGIDDYPYSSELLNEKQIEMVGYVLDTIWDKYN